MIEMKKIRRGTHWSDDYDTWVAWAKDQGPMALSRKSFINNTLRLTPIKTRGWALFAQTIKNATPSPVFFA